MGLPGYVTGLTAVYGEPTQGLVGNAVFHAVLKPKDSLSDAALEKCKFFLGKWWTEDFQKSWKLIYKRPANATRKIVSELGSLSKPQAQDIAYLITDNIDNPAAKPALAAAYDDPSTTDLTVHMVDNGEGISGLVIAGRRTNGEATFLVFLTD